MIASGLGPKYSQACCNAAMSISVNAASKAVLSEAMFECLNLFATASYIEV